MKGFSLAFIVSLSLVCFLSCTKNNNSNITGQKSTCTFRGIIDTGLAMSVGNNIRFQYAIKGGAKSKTLNFYSSVRQNYIYSVADTLLDSTECTIFVNDGNG
jgi:hypothetical protein